MISFILTNLFSLLGIGGVVLLIFLVFFINPYESSPLFLYLFYFGVFASIFSIYFGIEFNLRKRFIKLQTELFHLKKALISSFLLAIGICVLLFLQMIRVLTIWDATLLLITVILLQLYFNARYK